MRIATEKRKTRNGWVLTARSGASEFQREIDQEDMEYLDAQGRDAWRRYLVDAFRTELMERAALAGPDVAGVAAVSLLARARGATVKIVVTAIVAFVAGFSVTPTTTSTTQVHLVSAWTDDRVRTAFEDGEQHEEYQQAALFDRAAAMRLKQAIPMAAIFGAMKSDERRPAIEAARRLIRSYPIGECRDACRDYAHLVPGPPERLIAALEEIASQ